MHKALQFENNFYGSLRIMNYSVIWPDYFGSGKKYQYLEIMRVRKQQNQRATGQVIKEIICELYFFGGGFSFLVPILDTQCLYGERKKI